MSIPTNPYSPTDDTSVTQEGRTMAIIAYVLAIFTVFVGPLIMWLLMKNKNKFAAYHANQAMSLEIAVFCLLFFLGIILSAVHLEAVTRILDSVVALGALALNIVAAIAASKGDWFEMPLFGKYAKKAVGM